MTYSFHQHRAFEIIKVEVLFIFMILLMILILK